MSFDNTSQVSKKKYRYAKESACHHEWERMVIASREI